MTFTTLCLCVWASDSIADDRWSESCNGMGSCWMWMLSSVGKLYCFDDVKPNLFGSCLRSYTLYALLLYCLTSIRGAISFAISLWKAISRVNKFFAQPSIFLHEYFVELTNFLFNVIVNIGRNKEFLYEWLITFTTFEIRLNIILFETSWFKDY